MSENQARVSVVFVSVLDNGVRVSVPAVLNLDTGFVDDVEFEGDENIHFVDQFIQINFGGEEVEDREFSVTSDGVDDEFFLVDKSDLQLIRRVWEYVTPIEGGESKIDVTLNTLDDEGDIVDTTSMPLSKDAISDIIDHAAQLVLVLRSGGDAQGVLANLEEALTSRSVIAEDATEISIPSSPKGNAGVAKKLAKAIQNSGLTLNGLPVTHGRALEVVSNVAGLPNWDTLSAVLKKTEEKPEPLTAEQIIDRHYRGHSSSCPYCHSEDVSGNSFEADSGGATQEVGCDTCGAEWLDVYKLVGVDLTVGNQPEHELSIRMESDVFGAETFNYDSLEDRIEGLKRLMSDKALKDGVARKYTFFLFDGDDVVEGTESVVAEWSGKKWTLDEYEIFSK